MIRVFFEGFSVQWMGVSRARARKHGKYLWRNRPTARGERGAGRNINMTTEIVYDIQNLVKLYPRQPMPANRCLNLQIYSGEIFGLLGDNGAGKTTLGGGRALSTIGAALRGLYAAG
jgi:ABC-type glutathione transport system ATPase component